MTSPSRPYWPGRAAAQVDAGDLLRAGVVRDVENRSHLDHGLNPLLGPLDDLADPPALGLRQRTRSTITTSSPTLHRFSSSCAWNFLRPLHRTLVEPVRDEVLDRHDDGLLHLVAHHHADLDLLAARSAVAVAASAPSRRFAIVMSSPTCSARFSRRTVRIRADLAHLRAPGPASRAGRSTFCRRSSKSCSASSRSRSCSSSTVLSRNLVMPSSSSHLSSVVRA